MDVDSVGVSGIGAEILVNSNDMMDFDTLENNLVKSNSLTENEVDLDSLDKNLVDSNERLEVVNSNSVNEKRVEEENEATLDTLEKKNVTNNSVSENRLEEKVENLVNLNRMKENDMVLDHLEKKNLVKSSVREERLVYSNEKTLVVNDLGANSVGKERLDKNTAPVLEKTVEENNVSVKKNLVGDKRVLEETNVSEQLGRKKKKVKVVDTSKEMKRIAEIVLVLSAMGNMRGGRSPTAIEKQIMAEAREKLVGLCEGMSPKEIVPKDAVRVVIEDLGLNRVKDYQRMNFRPPMLSIKEKLQLSKKKMEESEKFALQSAIYSSQKPQVGSGAKNESHGAFVHSIQRFPDKPSQSAVLTGGSETIYSLNHTNQAQSIMVPKGPVSSPLERDASSLPRPETVHFRLDGRPNVAAYASQVRANSSGDHLLGKTPTSAPQLQSGAVARVGLANKVPDNKAEATPVVGVSQAASLDPKIRNPNHSVTQTAYGIPQAVQQPLQGLNFVHNEIAKNVQRFLHPKRPQHPSWTPPSTDYMNKSLTCQACKGSVNDVESLLVCDACERGNHIKCLQSYNQKGIPKGEWHCPHCLLTSNGKPLPPKYGRVTRNTVAPKVSSNAAAAVQPSAEKKMENSDQKVNHQKVTANGNPVSLHPANAGRAGNNHIATTADLKMSNVREAQTANSSGNNVKIGNDPLSGHKSLPNDVTGLPCAFSSGKPNDSNQQLQPCESGLEPKVLPNCVKTESCLDMPFEADTCHRSQTPCNSQDVGKSPRQNFAQLSSDQYNSVKVHESRETSDCKLGFDVRKDGEDAAQTVSAGNVGVGNGARDCLKSSLDGLQNVDWVGDILQVVGEKAFYRSCDINGTVYKLQDHALFRSNNGNLRPSKLQALWEDIKTGSKWAIVNSCYFPADLPEVVGRPCSPENNEVYESNHGSTVRAGLVQGPCEVLPPNKFKAKTERRTHSEDGTQPVFLCKWFYDESKGLFRPVTD